MKNLLFGLFLTLITTLSFAQMPQMRGGGQAPSGRFYGKIVDASNKGIEAATVTLVTTKMDSVTRKPAEVVVGGWLTRATGDFSIENVPAFGKYKLKVTGIGFKSYEANVGFEMPNRNNTSDMAAMMGALDKDLGNIKLELDEQVLGGITVTASRPMLQMGIDRKIFNVDRNIVSAGGSAVDVMRNVPSLNVDIDGGVTLRNNAPQIFVDGRPTNLTLEQIPADAIESVEIITNPSAKFDASGGTAGILNIVLKKNKRVGYSGNLRTNIDSRARVGFGGDINVRQNKVNFFASGMYNQRRSISEGSNIRETFRFNPSQSFQYDNSTMNGAFGFGRAGIDFFLDNRNTFTLNGTFSRGNMNPFSTSSIFSDIMSNGSIDSLQERSNSSANQFRNYGTQLSYKHNFPKAGHEITADVTLNKGRNTNDIGIVSDYYAMTPSKAFNRSFNQQQLGNGENNNLVIQTDYTKPLGPLSKIEAGARVQIRDMKNLTEYFILGQNGFKLPIEEQMIDFSSTDKVYAAYTSFSNRIKNFGYQLGLRVESSDYQGNLNNKNQSFNVEFPVSLFPSVFLSQKLNDFNDIQMNYSRRINRPNFWQLFPFTDISDSLNITRGNPGLNPEFTNSLELSYSKAFKNRDNIIISGYFKNTNNLITRFQEREYVPAFEDTLLVLSYINANKSYVTGLELTGRNKITKFWDVTSNINLFTAKISLNNQPDPDQFFSYFVKINNSFKLPQNFTLQLSGDYQSKIIAAPGGSGGGGGGRMGGMWGGGGQGSAAQGFIRPNYGVDVALRYEFMKDKKASLSLNVNDIFRTRLFSSFNASPFFEQDIERRRDPQVARLNFNWRFGKFDANLFKRKNTRAEGNVDMGNVNM
jgi:outer membrane receptor protein involved in Fe transport